MDMETVEEFIRLAETCSFQETAALLHISQSSLSKHLKKLESELGATLFDRSTRSVTLSEYGRAFLPHARRMAVERAAALTALRELSSAGRRTSRQRRRTPAPRCASAAAAGGGPRTAPPRGVAPLG